MMTLALLLFGLAAYIGAGYCAPKDSKSELRVGMRLEAWDPDYSASIWPATVVGISRVGHNETLHIHYDGHEDSWDVNISRSDTRLHPIGFGSQKGLQLIDPPGWHDIHDEEFSWNVYFAESNLTAVPFEAFTEEQIGGVTPFKITAPKEIKLHKNMSSGIKKQPTTEEDATTGLTAGMRLEAWDSRWPEYVWPATVQSVLPDGKLLIHYDGWTSSWDIKISPADPMIHPVGYGETHGLTLEAPPDWKPSSRKGSSFAWIDYLSAIDAKAAPQMAFTKEQRDGVTHSHIWLASTKSEPQSDEFEES